MNYKLLLILVIISTSCNQTQSSKAIDSNLSDYEQTLKAKEAVEPQRESLGELISTIEFKLKGNKEDLEIFEDGIVPWISLENPEEEISRLHDAQKIVLPYSSATLVIDYPLNQPASFLLSTSESGFTRKQLIREISKRYHQIYQEEEKSATVKTIPLDKREGLINRNETNGKFGVWGHDLSDLDLSAVEVYKNSDGKISLVLSVES